MIPEALFGKVTISGGEMFGDLTIRTMMVSGLVPR